MACFNSRTRGLWLAALIGGLLGLGAGCLDNSDVDDMKPPQPRAKIERSTYGVPHITADDFNGLGFGQGYVTAQDRLCLIADQIVKVRSERSYYFGPGNQNAHIESDFAYKALQVMDKAQAALSLLSVEARAMVAGFVEGYNQYLAETAAADYPSDCRNQNWVKPITTADLMAYYLDIAMLAGSRNFLSYIAAAAPPTNASLQRSSARLAPKPSVSTASNGIALGQDKTVHGRGMVLSNTHLPWEGELKYHEVQLTIPGQFNVAGVTLTGAIGVLIGFNEHLAWTHTTSTSNQFTVYKLTLKPGNPLAYLYDASEKEITSFSAEIAVKQPDGSWSNTSRMFYRSHYGPIIEAPALGLNWTNATAYTFKDMNADNYRLLETFLHIARAKNINEFKAIFHNIGGVPWNNTMAADKDGKVFYADTTLVPHLRQEALAAYQHQLNTDMLTRLFKSFDVVLLNGSDSLFEWQETPSATLRGAIPFSQAPQLERTDFVANMNNSYWIANPQQPLTGYSLLYGAEETVLQPRARMGFKLIAEMGGDDGRFSLDELKSLMFCDRSLTAELFLQDLIERCRKHPQIFLNDETIDLAPAVAVLSQWDGRFDPDSPGAILFREFMGEFTVDEVVSGSVLYEVPFDPHQPIDTPHTLKQAPPDGPDPMLAKLAAAMQRLQQTGIPLNATLRDYQFTEKGGQRIPVPGGLQVYEGAFNKVLFIENSAMLTTLAPGMSRKPFINPRTGLTQDGYPVNYGTTYILAVEFTENGPSAEGLLVYSQSDHPDSPHFLDQTRLFSEKKWRPAVFR